MKLRDKLYKEVIKEKDCHRKEKTRNMKHTKTIEIELQI